MKTENNTEKTRASDSNDQLTSLDYCPICHAPGMDYEGWPHKPIGRYVTKKSLPKNKCVWVDCSMCQLRTAGHPTTESAAAAWNRRSGKDYSDQYRLKIIRAAKIALDALEYDESENLPKPEFFQWG